MKKEIKKTLNKEEQLIFETYKTPQKIQDFINSIPMRNDSEKPIVRSPREALKNNTISCIEGAMLACTMLAYHGYKSYLLDLKVDTRNDRDSDHVVALFENNSHFGAISKTSHAVLRYREPIYKSVREIAMTYFHEYFLNDGTKTLRSFSEKFSVFKNKKIDWIISSDDLYEIACSLDASNHTKILTPKMVRELRKADKIEIDAGQIKE